MKKYKLIKEFPGSPELGTVEEPVGFIHMGSNGNFQYGISTTPEFWEKVEKTPEYVKCTKTATKEYIADKIYKVENKGAITERGYLGKQPLPKSLLNHYRNADFVAVSEEEYEKQ